MADPIPIAILTGMGAFDGQFLRTLWANQHIVSFGREIVKASSIKLDSFLRFSNFMIVSDFKVKELFSRRV